MVEWFCTICYEEQKTEKQVPESCAKCGAGSASIIPLTEESSHAKGGDFVGRFENLEQVRDRARTKLKGICAAYPHCDGGSDRICQREAYGKPIGLGGAGSGASFTANVTSLERLRLQTRLVGEPFDPDASFSFFGLKLSMPVMGSSTAGISRYNDAMGEVDFCRATIRGCREAGTLTWRGDTWFYTPENSPALDALEMEGGYGVPISNPGHRMFSRG